MSSSLNKFYSIITCQVRQRTLPPIGQTFSAKWLSYWYFAWWSLMLSRHIKCGHINIIMCDRRIQIQADSKPSHWPLGLVLYSTPQFLQLEKKFLIPSLLLRWVFWVVIHKQCIFIHPTPSECASTSSSGSRIATSVMLLLTLVWPHCS